MIDTSGAEEIGTNGDSRGHPSGKGLRQSTDDVQCILDEVTKTHQAEAEAVGVVTSGAVQGESVHCIQISIGEWLKGSPTESGNQIQLVKVKGIKRAPIIGDVPVETGGGFGLVEWS